MALISIFNICGVSCKSEMLDSWIEKLMMNKKCHDESFEKDDIITATASVTRISRDDFVRNSLKLEIVKQCLQFDQI